PPQASGVLLTREELAELRSRAVQSEKAAGDGAPGEGLTAVNRTDVLSYVLLDGVAIGWVRPHGDQYVIGPKPGRYTVSWRDFFGMEVETPRAIELPARVVLGTD